MNEIIQKIQSLITSARASLNQTLTALPPIEQFEAASEITGILRTAKYSVDYMSESLQTFDAQMAQLQAKISEHVTGQVADGVASGIQAQLAAGELVKKDDAEASLQAALQVRESSVRAEIKKIQDRRGELTAGEGAIPMEVAVLLSDETLAADDFKVRASKAADRVKELTELGVSVPRVLCESANLPLDEAGEAAHSERMATFRGVAAKHGAAPSSLSGGGSSQSGSPSAGPVIAM
jgi:hypothetical protein